jgi:pre-mRNA cleavage complex 2 protein Pcf11
VFYLLDSIAKNAFDPYATAFRDGIYGLFSKAYDAVDQPTKHKMREMMATWRNGAPNNRELFGPHVQSQIEQRVWGSTVRRLLPRPQARSLKSFFSSVQRLPTSSQVLTELDVVLVQKERAAQQNPYDELLPRHINALHEVMSFSTLLIRWLTVLQLRRMVPTMNTDDLAATLTRLREMARASVAPAQPPPAPQSMPAPYGHSSFPPAMPQLSFGYPGPAPPMHTVLQPPQQALPSVTPPPPALNAQNIISLLSSITSLQPAKVSVTGPGPIEISATSSVEDYEKAILQCKIRVTSNDIARSVFDRCLTE